jgi:hypothetical protein
MVCRVLSNYTRIHMQQQIPMIEDTSELYLVTGDDGCIDTKKPLQHCSACRNPSEGPKMWSGTSIWAEGKFLVWDQTHSKPVTFL